MVREIVEAIKKRENVRQNLSKLRQLLKEHTHRHAVLYYLTSEEELFLPLLKEEDAKTRKNVALIMGQLGKKEYMEPLIEAYQKEEQLFVKSAYLIAIKAFDYRRYLPVFQTRLEELSRKESLGENKKHYAEEMRELNDLILTMQGRKQHPFTGWNEDSHIILITNRDHIEVTLNQLETMKAKAFNAGIIVRTNQLQEILPIRTYEELLFILPDLQICSMEVEEAAKAIVKSSLLSFMEKRHKGKAPYYFRLELKTKMDIAKKSSLAKRLASEIETLSQRQLVNTTSQYEFEIRLIENKEGMFRVLLKLYTIKDARFDYRKEVLPTSIRPTNAALTVALAHNYMREGAQVLDPFCGVGTMLIERHKLVKANTMYGIDYYGEAIEKARENTDRAKQIIHYVQRNFFEFAHDYLFDEIITNMPSVTNHTTEEQIEELYRQFFIKAKQHLKKDGIIILYTHNPKMAIKYGTKEEFRLKENNTISKREGTCVVIFQLGD